MLRRRSCIQPKSGDTLKSLAAARAARVFQRQCCSPPIQHSDAIHVSARAKLCPSFLVPRVPVAGSRSQLFDINTFMPSVPPHDSTFPPPPFVSSGSGFPYSNQWQKFRTQAQTCNETCNATQRNTIRAAPLDAGIEGRISSQGLSN